MKDRNLVERKNNPADATGLRTGVSADAVD
ncbi:hypothetical protein HIMB100_00019560 [SAR116 cluster alpha proteobacterium HIMB100]|nr:hypothetical protein HIMB100_00019560 [SAR116 cluster alpha proteobacterium HIMB100]